MENVNNELVNGVNATIANTQVGEGSVKKSEAAPVSPAGKGNRRWLGGFVKDLIEMIVQHPNLTVDEKSATIGGIRAMLNIFKNFALHHVPVDNEGRVIINPNRPPDVLQDADGTKLVLPVVPLRTVLVPLITDITTTLNNFNDDNPR